MEKDREAVDGEERTEKQLMERGGAVDVDGEEREAVNGVAKKAIDGEEGSS